MTGCFIYIESNNALGIRNTCHSSCFTAHQTKTIPADINLSQIQEADSRITVALLPNK